MSSVASRQDVQAVVRDELDSLLRDIEEAGGPAAELLRPAIEYRRDRIKNRVIPIFGVRSNPQGGG